MLNILGFKTKFCCSGHFGINPRTSLVYRSKYMYGDKPYELYEHEQSGTSYVVFDKKYEFIIEAYEKLSPKYKHITISDRPFGIYGPGHLDTRSDYLTQVVKFRNFLRDLVGEAYKYIHNRKIKPSDYKIMTIQIKENTK